MTTSDFLTGTAKSSDRDEDEAAKRYATMTGQDRSPEQRQADHDAGLARYGSELPPTVLPG